MQGSVRSVSSLAPSGPERRLGDDDVSFTKRKGVVNTIGGAKDVARVAAAAPEPLRRSDALKSGGVHTLSALSAAPAPAGKSHRTGSAPAGDEKVCAWVCGVCVACLAERLPRGCPLPRPAACHRGVGKGL